ncbi:hypothetical protein DICVIV_05559 [Dictyocaulus viviparus]|uniref:Uncharacterized protein n=1 Tax=Dictyocaulus viviparus TaxID=29172 RepID=A0A0D8XUN6_DICVI|nr:hypothetical protein DICVIV_05559 [Dictyocaulus viviparus]
MHDSSDFTFLPPLSSQQHASGGRHEHSPVKQVQVHTFSSQTPTAPVKAVPVPSQRNAFTKIEERRQGIKDNENEENSAIPSPSMRGNSTLKRTASCQSGEMASIPSVENMTLPPKLIAQIVLHLEFLGVTLDIEQLRVHVFFIIDV